MTKIEDAIETIAAEYARRGYQVTVGPTSEELPPFASDFRIPIMGKMRDIGVLVAIKRNRREFAEDPEMERYARVAAAQPGWRFDFVLLEGDGRAGGVRGMREPTLEQIERMLLQSEALKQQHPESAFLSAWSALEAAMRMKVRSAGEGADGGRTEVDLMNELVSDGAITYEEYADVRKAQKLRNELVHGFLPTEDASLEIAFLADLTRRLLAESKATSSA